MRKFLHVTVATIAMMAATLVYTPPAKAGVDSCTYAAWQFCEGVMDPSGQYLHPGAPDWLTCVNQAKQYMIECEPPPSDGSHGLWCYTGWLYWTAC